QVLTGVPVPSHIRLELLGPPGRVVLRWDVVERAPVPVTTIDEDRHTRPREGNVDAPASHAGHRKADPVPQSATVQDLPDFHLRSGVLAALGPHSVPHLLGWGVRRLVQTVLIPSARRSRTTMASCLASQGGTA